MLINDTVLKSDERAAFLLRSLYKSYGYSHYKMSKFEEYALYIKNKDFLVSDGIISFTDTSGKLLALKPDVTLSIINNSKDDLGQVQKLYYDENVYRISSSSHSYKEIKQTGLECIGDVGLYEVCEVVMLAIASLKTITSNYMLEISHAGIVESVFEELGIFGDNKKTLLNCIWSKNTDELLTNCDELGVDESVKASLVTFVANYKTFDDAVAALKKVCVGDKSKQQLCEFESILDVIAKNSLDKNVCVDFSLSNNMSYYSGVAFKGYIEGIPASVISGGRYDKLMQNMGKKSGAVGFAVYLDALERYNFSEKEYDVDTVIIHNNNISAALDKANELINNGLSVRVCEKIPTDVKYKNIIDLKGEDK